MFNKNVFLWICGHILEKYIKIFIFSTAAGSRAISTEGDLLNICQWPMGRLFWITASCSLWIVWFISIPAHYTLPSRQTDQKCTYKRRSWQDVHIWFYLETRKDIPIGTSYERSDVVRLKDVFFRFLNFFLPYSLENKNCKDKY